MTTFPAGDLARAWLAVSQAASDDDSRPALTGVCVETYGNGVRLIATDSYMLFHAFVGAETFSTDFDTPPDLDETPIATETILDPDNRGAALFAYANKLAKHAEKEHLEPPTMTLCFGEGAAVSASAFEGLEPRVLHIDLPGLERVTLPTFDGPYPTWRPIVLDAEPQPASVVHLSQHVLTRVVKAAKLFPIADLAFDWGGTRGAAAVSINGSEPWVSGIVMPVKVSAGGLVEEAVDKMREALGNDGSMTVTHNGESVTVTGTSR